MRRDHLQQRQTQSRHWILTEARRPSSPPRKVHIAEAPAHARIPARLSRKSRVHPLQAATPETSPQPVQKTHVPGIPRLLERLHPANTCSWKVRQSLLDLFVG